MTIDSGEVEAQILGHILFDRKSAEQALRDLNDEFFSVPEYATIFAGIDEIVRHGYPMSEEVLTRILQEKDLLAQAGGMETIEQILPYAQNIIEIDYYIDRLRDAHRQRVIYETAQWMQYQVERKGGVLGAEEFDGLMEEFHNRMIQAATGTSASFDSREALRELLIAGATKGEVGYNPGFDQIHAELGNLVPGKMYVVSAYSGQGKSTLLANMFARMTDNEDPVAVFSTEMGPDFLHRVVSIYARMSRDNIDYRKLERGLGLDEKETAAYQRALNDLYARRFWRANWRASLTPAQLFANMRVYYGEGARVFIIDHGHRLRYNPQNKLEHIADTAVELRNFAKDKQCVVVVAYQPRKPDLGAELSRPLTDAEVRGLSEVWNEMDGALYPFRPWVKTGPDGRTETDLYGRPLLLMTQKAINKTPEDERKLDDEHFYVKIGKRRAGGEGGIVFFPFDNVNGAIMDRKPKLVRVPDNLRGIAEDDHAPQYPVPPGLDQLDLEEDR